MNSSDQQQAAPVHNIRLGSQWDLEQLSGTQHTTQRLRNIADVASVVGADYCGPLRLARSFGRPSGLTSSDRVDLVITPALSAVNVSLNARSLTSSPTAERRTPSDITPQLRYNVLENLEDRNRLVIEIHVPKDHDGSAMIGDVRLEIFAMNDA